jgi:hypothetical protein
MNKQIKAERMKETHDSYVVFQTDYFNVNKGAYIKLRIVTVTVMEPWLALSYQNDC